MTTSVILALSSGSFRPRNPSTNRLPTWAGAPASSQPWTLAEDSHSTKRPLFPSRRFRWNQIRSIAMVPTAPATAPRSTAPKGEMSERRIGLDCPSAPVVRNRNRSQERVEWLLGPFLEVPVVSGKQVPSGSSGVPSCRVGAPPPAAVLGSVVEDTAGRVAHPPAPGRAVGVERIRLDAHDAGLPSIPVHVHRRTPPSQ